MMIFLLDYMILAMTALTVGFVGLLTVGVNMAPAWLTSRNALWAMSGLVFLCSNAMAMG